MEKALEIIGDISQSAYDIQKHLLRLQGENCTPKQRGVVVDVQATLTFWQKEDLHALRKAFEE